MVSESHLLWLLATSAWVLSFLFLSQVLSTRGGTSWHLCGIFKLPTSLHVYFKAISSIPKRVLLKYKHRSTGPGGAVIKTAVHEQESSTVQIIRAGDDWQSGCSRMGVHKISLLKWCQFKLCALCVWWIFPFSIFRHLIVWNWSHGIKNDFYIEIKIHLPLFLFF